MQTQIFTYEDESPFPFTAIEINGEAWFIATEVCKLLDLSNVPREVATLDDDEKLLYEIRISGQRRKVNIINESGLYALIFKSGKPTAKRFRKWVTKVVLPTIRKTGSFDGIDRKKLPNFIKRYQDNWARVDKGYFSVLAQLYITLYSALERHGYVIPDKAKDGKEIRPDVSVGRRFSDYLQAHYPEHMDKHKPYKQKFPDGSVFPCRQYRNEVLPVFIQFVEEVWIPLYAAEYLGARDRLALDYLPKLLGDRSA